MDVVCPVGSRRAGLDQLVWAARSWMEFLPDPRLILVGSVCPPGLKPDVFVKTGQRRSKFWNIGENLEAAVNSDQVADEFVWMNDDFFLLEPMPVVPLTGRNGSWDEVVDWLGPVRGTYDFRRYISGFRQQRDLIGSWGFDTSREVCGDAHTPIWLEKQRVVDVQTAAREGDPYLESGHFKGLYAAGLDPVRVTDPKVKKVDVVPSGWMVSTSEKSWLFGAAGEWLRTRFAVGSGWE